MGEAVLDLVIPYLDHIDDRNSVSLVSRKSYETDGITRKRLTLHLLYFPNPPTFLHKRFPFIEALTLKGPPSYFKDYRIQVTPWIQLLAIQFKCLKELHIHGLALRDEDLLFLSKTRGKDLRSLKLTKCEGFSTNGLSHVAKYCNQLRTLYVGRSYDLDGSDGIWLHELALNNMVLERLYAMCTNDSCAEDLTLLAKNCSKSLVSLKIGACYLSKLGDAFRYAVRLEHFAGIDWDEEEDELAGFRFPPNIHSLSLNDLLENQHSIIVPFLNRIRKLKLSFMNFSSECQCMLFKRCPNLEVLHAEYACGDEGLEVIGQFCKKLRKLTYNGLVTHVGLIDLACGCTKLECLNVRLTDISNEAIVCVGECLQNLRKFRMNLVRKNGATLDNGIQVMLAGCSKLQTLDITLLHGGLTDVGLEHIGKYGANLRSLSLTLIGNSNAGLVKLSEGCPQLRKLKLTDCPFSKQDVACCVFNIPSLMYVWADDRISTIWALIRPEFQR